MTELWVFAGVVAVGQFSPGPDFLLITRTSLTGGGRAGSWTAVGIATGLVVHATVAVGGTAAIFRAGGWLSETMRWVAAAYLAWLGFLLLRAVWRGSYTGAGTTGAANHLTDLICWRRGFLTNLLNPKVALFLAAAAAPFLAGTRPTWWPAAIWLVIVGEGIVLWIAWAWLLQAPPVNRVHSRAARWIDAGFGLALIGLALRLALA
jgi:threonine/homoserine/homoserine lactone efflux protein